MRNAEFVNGNVDRIEKKMETRLHFKGRKASQLCISLAGGPFGIHSLSGSGGRREKNIVTRRNVCDAVCLSPRQIIQTSSPYSQSLSSLFSLLFFTFSSLFTILIFFSFPSSSLPSISPFTSPPYSQSLYFLFSLFLSTVPPFLYLSFRIAQLFHLFLPLPPTPSFSLPSLTFLSLFSFFLLILCFSFLLSFFSRLGHYFFLLVLDTHSFPLPCSCLVPPLPLPLISLLTIFPSLSSIFFYPAPSSSI